MTAFGKLKAVIRHFNSIVLIYIIVHFKYFNVAET